MNHAQTTFAPRAVDLCGADWGPAVARASAAPGDASHQDGVFIALLNAYRAHGGLSRLQNLTGHGYVRSDGQGCEVEDLLIAQELFGFQWCRTTWIPMFQFTLHGKTLSTGPQRVVAELDGVFDSWTLATWFVVPNVYLANHSPIECLDSHLPYVLEAARKDRLVATG